MNRLALAFVLAAPLMAQNAPFSQPWNTSDTGAWPKRDSIRAGAVVAAHLTGSVMGWSRRSRNHCNLESSILRSNHAAILL